MYRGHANVYTQDHTMSIARLTVKRSLTTDGEQPDQRLEDKFDKVANNRQTQLHLLPCKIYPRQPMANRKTQTAPVDRYFCPYTKGPTVDVHGSTDATVWHASLRGKPLTGVKLDLPDGYVGVLCNSSNSSANDNDSVGGINFIADDKDGDVNQQLMYWNWDRVPTREDPLLAALNWIHLSEAIMSNND